MVQAALEPPVKAGDALRRENDLRARDESAARRWRESLLTRQRTLARLRNASAAPSQVMLSARQDEAGVDSAARYEQQDGCGAAHV